MEILQHEHERPLICERLQESAPRRERHVAVPAGICTALNADERSEVALHPDSVSVVDDERPHSPPELCRRVWLRVRLEDARLRLDDLPECPESDALAVRERSSLAPGD